MKKVMLSTVISVILSSPAWAQQSDDATQANDAWMNRTMLSSPADISREGYVSVMEDELTADDLTDSNVYGANDEDIGEIDELILGADGKTIDKVILEVGGFLGMGEHEIAVTMEELHIMRSDDGSDFRVYINATQEELEAQPEYDS